MTWKDKLAETLAKYFREPSTIDAVTMMLTSIRSTARTMAGDYDPQDVFDAGKAIGDNILIRHNPFINLYYERVMSAYEQALLSYIASIQYFELYETSGDDADHRLYVGCRVAVYGLAVHCLMCEQGYPVARDKGINLRRDLAAIEDLL